MLYFFKGYETKRKLIFENKMKCDMKRAEFIANQAFMWYQIQCLIKLNWKKILMKLDKRGGTQPGKP